MQYHEQLKHPLWQKKRLEVMEANNFKCQNCGGKDEQLNVHHPFYKRGAMIWQYVKEELMCLCHECHKNEHAKDEEIKSLCSRVTVSKDFLIGLLRGYVEEHPQKLYNTREVQGYLAGFKIGGSLGREFEKKLSEVGNVPGMLFSGKKATIYDVYKVLSRNSFTFDEIMRLAEEEANGKN